MNAYERSLYAAVKLLDNGYKALEKPYRWDVGKDFDGNRRDFEPREVFCLECKTKTDTTLIDKSFGHEFGTEVLYREVTLCCASGFEEIE